MVERVRSEKERQICAACLALMRETDDLSQIKVSDIAQRAGVGKGTVYEYYKSKEDVLADAHRCMLENNLERFRKSMLNREGFYARINAMAEAVMESFADFPRHPKNIFWGFEEEPGCDKKAYMAGVRALFLDVLQAGAEEKLFPVPASHFAIDSAVLSWLACLFVGSMQQDKEELGWEGILQQANKLLLAALRE